jgi:hypothetical protein
MCALYLKFKLCVVCMMCIEQYGGGSISIVSSSSIIATRYIYNVREETCGIAVCCAAYDLDRCRGYLAPTYILVYRLNLKE